MLLINGNNRKVYKHVFLGGGMAKDRREDWGSFESDEDTNRRIRGYRWQSQRQEVDEDLVNIYKDFLDGVNDIGRGNAIRFKYTKQKVTALRELGIENLTGFGSLDNILESIEHRTCDNRTRVAVHNAYQWYISEAEKFLAGYQRKQREQ